MTPQYLKAIEAAYRAFDDAVEALTAAFQQGKPKTEITEAIGTLARGKEEGVSRVY
jgi:hypothetical protein